MITKPEIYTEDFVKKELADILAEVSSNDDLIFKGQVFEKKSYSSQRYSEWAEKFKENDEISETIKKIDGIFETRVVVGGLKGKLNPTMSIFNLKNNYGWRDKNETDITTQGDKIGGVIMLPQRHDGSLETSEETDSSPIKD